MSVSQGTGSGSKSKWCQEPVPSMGTCFWNRRSSFGSGFLENRVPVFKNHGSWQPVLFGSIRQCRRNIFLLLKMSEHGLQARKILLWTSTGRYLYGEKFLQRTDHPTMKWLQRFKGSEDRWIERLQEYDFVTKSSQDKGLAFLSPNPYLTFLLLLFQ